MKLPINEGLGLAKQEKQSGNNVEVIIDRENDEEEDSPL
jgi:hypothetical protein